MPRPLATKRPISHTELAAQLERASNDGHTRRLQALQLVSEGELSRGAIAKRLGRTSSWLTGVIHRFNDGGFAGLEDARKKNGKLPALSQEQFERLAVALESEPPDGDWWSDSKVRDWVAEQFGIKLHRNTGGEYLRRLGYHRVHPQEESVEKKEERRAAFAGASQRDYTSTSFANTPYPSDLTDAQWAILKPLLPEAAQRPHLREVVNAIFYVLRTGCPWDYLPRDFPPRGTVTSYFYKWRDNGVWEEIVHELRPRARQQAGRTPHPTATVIDSQSVKTTEKGGLADMTAQRKSKEESVI